MLDSSIAIRCLPDVRMRTRGSMDLIGVTVTYLAISVTMSLRRFKDDRPSLAQTAVNGQRSYRAFDSACYIGPEVIFLAMPPLTSIIKYKC